MRGLVLTMFDGRTSLSQQVADEVRSHFPGKVFRSVIPRSVRLAEAPSHGLPISAYDPSSPGGLAYRALAAELLHGDGVTIPRFGARQGLTCPENTASARVSMHSSRPATAWWPHRAAACSNSRWTPSVPTRASRAISSIPGGLKDLADSIRAHGVLQPLLVTPVPPGRLSS